MHSTNYQVTLDFLYSQLPMYQRIGNQAFKKGLGNTRALLKTLGNPHHAFPCIHIAGTNGKGTVAHMIAACLTAAGFKTGLYVSPHYRDFRERMKIDGKLIPRPLVVEIVEQMKPVIEEIKPSFFEMTVALAFEAFKRHDIDIAVIETGLGGRLDSTNVVSPLLSVITNISFDHMSMLGNTLPAIAKEKAGIIKKNTPVVIGEYQSVVAPVFTQIARQRKSPLSFADRKLKATLRKNTMDRQEYDVFSGKGEIIFSDLKVGASGPFQSANLVTALHAINVLGETNPEFQLTQKNIRRGMEGLRQLTGYQGRWHVLGKAPLILCDSGHNTAGLSLTLSYLGKLAAQTKHLVIGFVNDKELDGMLSLFPQDAIYYFCRPDIPRGLDAKELHAVAEMYGLNGKAYASVRSALSAAKRKAHQKDLIFIGGSTFVVAEVLKMH